MWKPTKSTEKLIEEAQIKTVLFYGSPKSEIGVEGWIQAEYICLGTSTMVYYSTPTSQVEWLLRVRELRRINRAFSQPNEAK